MDVWMITVKECVCHKRKNCILNYIKCVYSKYTFTFICKEKHVLFKLL
jgi:hypothetical protein